MNSDFITPHLLRIAAVSATLAVAAAGLPGADAQTSAPARSATAQNIRVGTFNVRNVALDLNGLASAQQPWAVRRDAIVKEILAEKLDVLGVQEASQNPQYPTLMADSNAANQYDDLRMGLRSAGGTYQLVNDVIANCVNPDALTKCVPQYRGASRDVRILYNTSTVSVVRSGSYLYHAQSSNPRDERYLPWAVLKTRATGKQFFFATTHLSVGHRAVQKRQWAELISQVRARAGRLPVIVTGDFQTNRWYTPATAMMKKMKQAGFGDTLGQRPKGGLVSHPRAKTRINTQLDSFNDFGRNLKQSGHVQVRPHMGTYIDWIWASNSLRVPAWKVVLKYDTKTKQIKGVIPSDHNLVRATIRLP